MARYIDADKLREYWLENGVNEHVYNTNSVLDSIDYQPTADVAEVVRCKDCKRCFEKRTKRNNQLMRFCMRMDGNEYQVNANDFCSYAERKEG